MQHNTSPIHSIKYSTKLFKFFFKVNPTIVSLHIYKVHEGKSTQPTQ